MQRLLGEVVAETKRGCFVTSPQPTDDRLGRRVESCAEPSGLLRSHDPINSSGISTS